MLSQVIKFMVLVLFALALHSCSTVSDTFRTAELTQVSFQPTQITPGEYTAEIRLKIKNPNTYAISAGEIKYKLSINNDDVANASFDRDLAIQPGAEEEVVGKIKFSYTSDRITQEKLIVEPYVLTGTASIGLHMLHFKHQGDFASSKK